MSLSNLGFERAGDVPVEDLRYKILIYGDSGVGKTWKAARAGGRVAFLLTEENGFQSVRRSNPDALVLEATHFRDVRKFFRAATSGELREAGVTAIGVDGLTEIQRLMMDEIVEGRADDASMTLQDWGDMTKRMRRLCRLIRGLDYDVVVTALAESQTDEVSGARYVQPQFTGKKLHNEVAQYFHAVGYAFVKQDRDGDGRHVLERRVMFGGPSRFQSKPCDPLTGVVESDPRDWFALLRGELGSPEERAKVLGIPLEDVEAIREDAAGPGDQGEDNDEKPEQGEESS